MADASALSSLHGAMVARRKMASRTHELKMFPQRHAQFRVDIARDTLHATSTRQAAYIALGRAFDGIAEDLARRRVSQTPQRLIGDK